MTLLEVATHLRTAADFATAGQPFLAARFVALARRGLDEATAEARTVPVARLRLVRGPEHVSGPITRVLEQIKPKHEGE